MNKKIFQYSYTLKKERQSMGIFLFFYILLVFIIVNVLVNFVIYPVRQTSVSMEPDIPQNSVVMISPISSSKIERGDVVLLNSRKELESGFFKNIFSAFVSFFSARQVELGKDTQLPCTKEHLRRVIGMPGDTIYMRDYVMYIKPENSRHFLTEFETGKKSYNVAFYTAPADWDSSIGVKGSFEQITLKENEYFVLSDNRKSGDDSRLWGIVTKEDFTGKALFCYFPLNKFKSF